MSRRGTAEPTREKTRPRREEQTEAPTRPPTQGHSASPQPWESGYKDTVIAYPGQMTRIIATFDLAGLYVWHCHIVEHEDNEMMRPYRVVSAQ